MFEVSILGASGSGIEGIEESRSGAVDQLMSKLTEYQNDYQNSPIVSVK